MPTKMIACAALTLALGAPPVADQADTKYHSKEYGFSIDPPRAAQLPAKPAMVVMFYLPASQRFAPNVNVRIQPFPGTLAEYAKVSVAEFKANNLTVVKQHLDAANNRLTLEYTGTLAGKKLHWSAVAAKSGKRVYLATATALESQWAASGPALVRSVKSLKLPAAAR